MKTYEEILKAKIDYYGRTEAAYQFAAEEFSNMNVTEQLRLHDVTQRSEQFFALLRYTMPDQFTDIALKNIVKGFIEQSK